MRILMMSILIQLGSVCFALETDYSIGTLHSNVVTGRTHDDRGFYLSANEVLIESISLERVHNQFVAQATLFCPLDVEDPSKEISAVILKGWDEERALKNGTPIIISIDRLRSTTTPRPRLDRERTFSDFKRVVVEFRIPFSEALLRSTPANTDIKIRILNLFDERAFTRAGLKQDYLFNWDGTAISRCDLNFTMYP